MLSVGHWANRKQPNTLGSEMSRLGQERFWELCWLKDEDVLQLCKDAAAAEHAKINFRL